MPEQVAGAMMKTEHTSGWSRSLAEGNQGAAAAPFFSLSFFGRITWLVESLSAVFHAGIQVADLYADLHGRRMMRALTESRVPFGGTVRVGGGGNSLSSLQLLIYCKSFSRCVSFIACIHQKKTPLVECECLLQMF